MTDKKPVAEVATFKVPELRPDSFDGMVVGEIVEDQNQTLDWWEGLPENQKLTLYQKQLAKPPRKGKRFKRGLIPEPPKGGEL